jgi:hypothetical protein
MPESVGRMELWASLGRITVAEAMINRAATYAAERQWRNRHLDAPHGQSWFTSMHVSAFPATTIAPARARWPTA